MNRDSLPVVAMALLLTLSLPVGVVAAADASGALPAANDLPDQTVGYGADATPGFVVQLTNGTNATTLEAWANQSASREIEQAPTTDGLAVVSAPQAAVTGAVLAFEDREVFGAVVSAPVVGVDGLAGESWVDYVEPELSVSRIKPVELQSNATFERPRFSRLAQARSVGQAEFGPEGVAYSEDANTTTMAESRALYGVDNVSADGSGVTVAVLDTGANVNNGTLFGDGTAGSTIRIDNASKSFVDGDSVNTSADDYSAVADGNGHGTWVASSIAADHTQSAYDGVAPAANLLVLKTLADDGSGSSADIAQGIRYAADEGADVISMSLGSQVYSEAIAESVQYAESEGSVVVIAAGNSRASGEPFVASPADTPDSNVITVAAANGSASVDTAAIGYFSQVGPDNAGDLSGGRTAGETVTVSATGMATEAMVVPDGASYTTTRELSGTSMATPQVAGVVALAMDADNSLRDDPEAVHDAVVEHARPMPTAAEAEAGAGMVAADTLIQDEETGTQADAMTTQAESRDTGWRSLSAASGGILGRALTGLGDVVGGVLP